MKTKMSIRLFTIALIAMFVSVFAVPAMANDEKKAMPVELKFVGNLKNEPLFHLVFSGAEETEYTIVIRDVYGNTLYKENVKGSSFTKKFLVKADELEEAGLKFEISSKNYEKPVVFEINNKTAYVENIVVNKLK